MIKAGYSPSVRLFEAAACGVPIISDRWPGIETFFVPGKEILLAKGAEEVIGILNEYSEEESAEIGRRAPRTRSPRSHRLASGSRVGRNYRTSGRVKEQRTARDLSMKTIRTAIVGVGNCASSLVQGVEFYRDATEEEFVPGLMHVNLGGYHPRDVVFTAAFDVSRHKVGLDLAEAIAALPIIRCALRLFRRSNVRVERGPTFDGFGQYVKDKVPESSERVVDVASILQESKTEVLVSYLPVGSERATCWYAEQALRAGCAFVNCIPVFIASNAQWQRRFQEHGLPLIGDDIKSQVGATIVHRMLTDLFRKRGVRLDRTYQLNFGGNSDFLNMLERERLESKKISKTQAVTSQLGHPMQSDQVHVGPSDYVPWLEDRKMVLHPYGRHDIRKRSFKLRGQT